MDFTFTEDQNMLRDAVSRCLGHHYTFDKRRQIIASPSGSSSDVWSQFHDLGLFALPFSQEIGGLGGSITDVVAVSELFGKHLVVEPYLSCVLLSAGLLAQMPDDSAGKAWLERILAGDAVAAFAHEEGHGTANLSQVCMRASPSAGGYILAGEKQLVLGGASCDVLVVSARVPDGGVGVFLVDPKAPQLRIRSFTTIDGRRASVCRFDDVRVPQAALLAANAGDMLAKTINSGIMALAAEVVGAMGVLLNMTVTYAATRKQFGVLIGSFQSIAHRLADMKLALVKAQSILLYTTALAESGIATSRNFSALKAQAGRLGRHLAESAVQIHGGIGMTDELAVGHYFKRILAAEAMFGSIDYHLQVVGSSVP
jgi:alkylation response protein AidB-like acyl-CoA dehydrogenase